MGVPRGTGSQPGPEGVLRQKLTLSTPVSNGCREAVAAFGG
jgi:hypothetical protein